MNRPANRLVVASVTVLGLIGLTSLVAAPIDEGASPTATAPMCEFCRQDAAVAKESESAEGCGQCSGEKCAGGCQEGACAGRAGDTNDESEDNTVAQRRGRGPGPGPGPGRGRGAGRGPDADFERDHDVFHDLLEHHKEIRRTVKRLEDGVETLTESDNPTVADAIQEHVHAMYRRVDENRPIRRRDPLFNAIFSNASKVKMQVEETDQGVRVIETSDDPFVARLIQAHAAVVSAFVKHGHAEAMKNHPVPAAE
ncbi:hypothetical protein [Maioricimonas rarisocia]|nr:hypothetical protein [Maioricimonas rarisocia]